MAAFANCLHAHCCFGIHTIHQTAAKVGVSNYCAMNCHKSSSRNISSNNYYYLQT